MAALIATFASVYLLIGTELVMVASLQRSGQAAHDPAGQHRVVRRLDRGGFAYGALRRPLPLAGLVAGLGAATLPIALAGPWWGSRAAAGAGRAACAPSIAAGAGVVSALAPDHARGFVLGLHTSSLTAGGAAASSFTGVLIDRWAPGPAVLVVGTLGIAAALFSWALARASPRRPSRRRRVPLSALSSRLRQTRRR